MRGAVRGALKGVVRGGLRGAPLRLFRFPSNLWGDNNLMEATIWKIWRLQGWLQIENCKGTWLFSTANVNAEFA